MELEAMKQSSDAGGSGGLAGADLAAAIARRKDTVPSRGEGRPRVADTDR